LAERENHRPSFKKSDAHFNEVQETAIAIITRKVRQLTNAVPSPGGEGQVEGGLKNSTKFHPLKKLLVAVPCVP
jgi:hypothetical protein